VVAEELREEQAQGKGDLLGFYEAFQKYLIARLSLEDFADLYAQTITYDLFAARTRSGDGFNRRTAFDSIPHTIGILRDVFRFISLGDLPKQLEWIVDEISGVLAVADAGGILDRFYREAKGSDPIIHFYETFLAEYDPEERERRGVYYTPEPVVSYIVRSLHWLLKEKFGRREGLASEGVTLLDPAAGTMTFVAKACEEAVREFEAKYGTGGRENFIREHILKNYYAFELMMAPYAVGHLKMSFFLEELGHRLSDGERFQFYLTNTLEMEELEQTHLPGIASLAEESHLAGEVKKQRPILVILGNPPYSGHSSNRGQWIVGLIEDYKQVDGKPLGEKNPKWLQDDYVKFLRFAQWKIEQAGQGVVGMITNHSYLDNPTFRGMRQSLMKSFDEIYLLDLHGNSLKKEACPDGSKDENVFDIRQGVAIAFLVKQGGGSPAKLYHADRWGLREDKYDWLMQHDVQSTDWQEILPRPEFHLFVPRDEAALEQYQAFPSVTTIFPLHGVGMTTARDDFVTDIDKSALIDRIRLFKHSRGPDEELHASFRINRKKGWNIRRAWEMLQSLDDGELPDLIVPVLYRPFDSRWIFYHDAVVWRTVKRIMYHMMQENVGLLWTRPMSPTYDFSAFSSRYVVDQCVVGNKSAGAGISYIGPLHLYPDASETEKDLLSHSEGSGGRKPNLNPKIVRALSSAHSQQPSPENIFHYIYAVLCAETYRQKYAEFLKTDFPRIPFTADFDLFRSLTALGRRLVDLHLLRSEELDPPAARFQCQGDNQVAKTTAQGFRYEPKEERVYINKSQYFEPVAQELWEYQIGGYQVLSKWLKDRRERRLTLEEVKTYSRIVTALQRTIALQGEIDGLYPGVEDRIVRFPNGT
jgi:predicted helicase